MDTAGQRLHSEPHQLVVSILFSLKTPSSPLLRGTSLWRRCVRRTGSVFTKTAFNPITASAFYFLFHGIRTKWNVVKKAKLIYDRITNFLVSKRTALESKNYKVNNVSQRGELVCRTFKMDDFPLFLKQFHKTMSDRGLIFYSNLSQVFSNVVNSNTWFENKWKLSE